jgi:hypothetical protein
MRAIIILSAITLATWLVLFWFETTYSNALLMRKIVWGVMIVFQSFLLYKLFRAITLARGKVKLFITCYFGAVLILHIFSVIVSLLTVVTFWV